MAIPMVQLQHSFRSIGPHGCHLTAAYVSAGMKFGLTLSALHDILSERGAAGYLQLVSLMPLDEGGLHPLVSAEVCVLLNRIHS